MEKKKKIIIISEGARQIKKEPAVKQKKKEKTEPRAVDGKIILIPKYTQVPGKS